MSDRPTLLFYCQHSMGLGHLVRSFALARALAERFRVVFLNGGRLPQNITPPDGVDLVQLPPLGMDIEGLLVSRAEHQSVDEVKPKRLRQILSAYADLDPQVILVELFPFGRKKFANELLPLFKSARQRGPAAPLILCSLRDILVGSRRDQQHHDNRASWIANRYLDAVLVHADPSFSRLEETFHPARPLTVPVHHTGFVVPTRAQAAPAQPRRRVVVSAGGGIVGAPLFRAALAAQQTLWETERLPMTVIAGPFLPEDDWNALRHAAQDRPGLDLHRSVPDLGAELQDAAASVSQCGYNTAMDVLYSGVPALFVPFAEGREDEQINRAKRLAKLALARVLEPGRLDAPKLAAEIRGLLEFRPASSALDLNGAANTARLVWEMSVARCGVLDSVST